MTLQVIRGGVIVQSVALAQHTATMHVGSAARAAADGVASLDGSGALPLAQVPDTLTGKDADTVDGSHAGNAANKIPILDGSGDLPLAQIPDTLTGKDADTVDGEHAADIVTTARVNSAGAFMDSEFLDQSFVNLLKNGDFESWGNGTSSAPDGWVYAGYGTGSVSRSATQVKFNSYSCYMVRGAGVNGKMTQELGDHASYQGKVVTFGCWAYSVAFTASRLAIDDGVGISYSSPHSGNSTWQWLEVSRTIDASATKVSCECHKYTYDNVGYFDGAIAVRGSEIPHFVPKFIPDDGILLSNHTPSAANDVGVAGQWCYDSSYIYVCIATDTWERAAIATW